ncbi:putative NAD(P)H quinone oxidoreductase, PIG3 family [Klenkia marina]|uniref:Putative NAD(P)H quinone oxidoreductase, PIG3 family n=1 Tax=Klenkia marina TaxID=1960309 RepID=A0A1G4XJ09_9ACTN|nr:NAD(P)H-quinone oxidoreductase [Klenkia marina]SCX40628.1 putative NAD(P)H quinone oxidoreductase, PIG3 family [Klenkia marina]
MRAITQESPGGPDTLVWGEVPDPVAGEGEVVLDVVASAVNRADLLQREGNYPVPPGASEVLGLECSGIVSEVGPGVEGWRVGDEVCALLAGGGYAERVAVPAAQLLPRPAGVELAAAAALPEVACTVWSNVFMQAGLAAGELLLVHGGGSGIGTMAIQLAKRAGARVATTAGSAEKLAFCRELGADITINYRDEDFVEVVRAAGGADVVLDNMGAAYLARNVAALAPDGRITVIGMQGGRKGELDIGALLAKRGSVYAAGLRGRPVEGRHGKGAVVAAVRAHVWPDVEAGRVRPVVHTRLPMARAADGHRILEESSHTGKVLLVND